MNETMKELIENCNNENISNEDLASLCKSIADSLRTSKPF